MPLRHRLTNRLEPGRARRLALGAGGLLLAVGGPYRYLAQGYDLAALAAWIGSIGLLYLALAGNESPQAAADRRLERDARSQSARPVPVDRGTGFQLDRRDRLAALALLAAFAPLYLLFTYQLPVQISSDEIVISLEAEWSSFQPSWDLFALSGYFDFPAMQFILFGALGRLAGGVNLHNMRLIHAAMGLLTIPLTYLMLRAVSSRSQAALAAGLLGANHALITIGRMAMRDVSALLLEVAALTLLLHGIRRSRSGWLYGGGALAGLSFYFYEPGRLTILVWMAMALLLIAQRGRPEGRRLRVRDLAVSLTGFAAVVAPLAAVSIRTGLEPGGFEYQRQQLLFTAEGLALQQDWIGAASRAEAVRINVVQGLLTFNSRLHDHGFIYYNPGYGFVDPLSGVLLWVGVGALLYDQRRQDRRSLLMLPGLIIPWLVFSFVVTKAPNYTRLLTTLPFVAYFAMRGIGFLSEWAAETIRVRRWGSLSSKHLGGTLVLMVVGWNLHAFGDYLLRGIREGELIGSTARYVEARREEPGYAFYIVTTHQFPYNPPYYPIEPVRWVEWLDYFAGEEQRVRPAFPHGVVRMAAGPPFTVFMNASLWEELAVEFTERYPERTVHPILADGSMLAVEVLESEDD